VPFSTLIKGPAQTGDSAEPRSPGERVVDGIGVAPGVAIGPVYLYEAGAWQTGDHLAFETVDAEVERFERAVARSERELKKIVTVAQEKLGEESARIFDAQLLMLHDPVFYDAVVARIRDDEVGAGHAVGVVLNRIRDRFASSDDHALRERSADFDDIRNRVLRNLQQGRALSKIDADHVVVARNLTAADVLLFSRRGVLGIVLDFGGPTSHVAIMARALGVPAVVSLHELTDDVRSGEIIVLDGLSGRVVVRPTQATVNAYRSKQQRYEALQENAPPHDTPAQTTDGHRVELQANVEFREEFPLLREFGAEGVGLFRTEMLFLVQGKALDEQQQFEVYRDVLRAAAPYPVTFRLIDLGGDKVLPLAHREGNPFLGWRGVRILTDKPEVLKPQIRAVLRAAAHGPARLLIPMVTFVDEVLQIRQAVANEAAELAAAGVAHDPTVPIGVMVEVPAVALTADRFAQHADFFSIGTNDLTQFTLGVDRGNDLVAHRYQELHPAVLTLIERAVTAAHDAGIQVSLCGELAGDPRMTPLLVGLGVDSLSASPPYLGLIRRVLNTMTLREARALADDALLQPDADSVRNLLAEWLRDHTPDVAAVLVPVK
jgi:phosphotransferase system enzyme I (PtsI)